MKTPSHPQAWSSPEVLETRIAPAMFFLSGADLSISTVGDNPATLDAGAAAMVLATAALPLKAGDSVVYDLDGDAKLDAGQDFKFLTIKSGMALAFFTDLNGNGKFEPFEFTGLAVGDRFNGTIVGDLNGSVVTNLDAAGIFTGPGLQPSSIAGLTVTGRIFGDIAAGGSIQKVTIKQPKGANPTDFSVERILTGSAADGITVSYDGSVTPIELDFTQAAGTDGGSISNVKIANGVSVIATGSGGDSLVGDGGWGGRISNVTVGGLGVQLGFFAGNGGEGLNFGGDGGGISGIKVATRSGFVLNTGSGGAATALNGVGGFGGNVSNFAITGSIVENPIQIIAGAGGTAGMGAAGLGGDILNGSIKTAGVAEGYTLLSGAGGSGNIGGAGGNIRQVTIAPLDNLGNINVIGGSGGNGTGPGGDGGNLDRVTVTTKFGLSGDITFVSGQGGDGGDIDRAGDGGSIRDVRVTSGNTIQGGIVFTAGGGGFAAANNALAGDGGDLLRIRVLVNGDLNETLTFLAGNGGDANTFNSGTGGFGGGVFGLNATVRGRVMQAVVIAGLGGDGGQMFGDAGDGGGIFSSTVNIGGSDNGVDFLAGNGGEATGGFGGHGGLISRLNFTSTGDIGVFNFKPLVLLAGSGGRSVASDGGFGGHIEVATLRTNGLAALNVLAGNGGVSDDGAGGDGGDVFRLVWQNSGLVASNDAVILAGSGGTSVNDGGGAGGSILSSSVLDPAGFFSRLIMLSGNGGDGLTTISTPGGEFYADGGNIQSLKIVAPRADVELFAGQGGSISNGDAGWGGSISDVTGVISTLSAYAGHGGTTGTGTGGDGGSITKLNLTANRFVRLLAAGDAGGGTDDGFAGNIMRVTVRGDIGDFRSAFDMVTALGMGGLSAGRAASGIPEESGIISGITANRIAAIVAGRPNAETLSFDNAVSSITGIKAKVIGADLDGDRVFDFVNAIGTAAFDLSPVPGNPSDKPIDGLVLVVAGGFAKPPVTPLFVVEV